MMTLSSSDFCCALSAFYVCLCLWCDCVKWCEREDECVMIMKNPRHDVISLYMKWSASMQVEIEQLLQTSAESSNLTG